MSFIICLFLLLLSATPARAIYDPVSLPNNKVGVHILSPDEIDRAADLVNNTSQGSWGYVTVPIQATDRDYHKWEKFMKKASELKIIPIVRVATYANGDSWHRPDDIELLDFANFLNELSWPIQNRYVIIFNEVNRADEYGGSVSPEDYAEILDNAITILKSRSDKFFVLPAGLDNAAPNGRDFMRWDTYLTRMAKHVPGIFERIDGWTSHAYSNPDFAMNPKLTGPNKANSFVTDLKLISKFTNKKLPVFITEAGWSTNALRNDTVATYYTHAMSETWVSQNIIAVTPFLLFANSDPFKQFSLLNSDFSPKPQYLAFKKFATHGLPLLENIKAETIPETKTESPTKADDPEPLFSIFVRNISTIIKKIEMNTKPKRPNTKNIIVAGSTYEVEVAKTPKDRQIGLAKYNQLEKSQGMLFLFEKTGLYGFWMKDMKFDIDIIWIKNNQVVGVSQAYFKNPYRTVYPPESVDTVLELPLNSGVKTGDPVILD